MFATSIIRFKYQKILKPILFKFDPEFVHDRFLLVGGLLGSNVVTRKITAALFRYRHPALEQEIHGIKFANPVGLSAGFDKDANLINSLPAVGFGFAEIGSITLHPYEGNPKPRLFRLKKSQGLVVYYGLKNIGVQKIIQKIQKRKVRDFPLSISIAKTNADSTASEEGGINDYLECLHEVIASDIGNFYTINISCPNTFGGEPFTTSEKLDRLLKKLVSLKPAKPMFVKMPINLSWEDFDKLLQVIVKYELQGVVIGNLNKDHQSETIKDEIPAHIKGGISGKPTWELSNDLIARTYKQYGGRLTIIGVGGIFTAEDAYHKLKLGASLVQLITGMIFEGPQVIGEINKGLVRLLKEDGFENIGEAVGASNNK